MQTKSQLDILAEQFSDWRATRSGSRLTHSHLANAALAIMNDYPRGDIFKALGINSNTVRRWEKKYTTPNMEADFIDLEPPVSPSPHAPLRLAFV